jgi:hypothetical protein
MEVVIISVCNAWRFVSTRILEPNNDSPEIRIIGTRGLGAQRLVYETNLPLRDDFVCVRTQSGATAFRRLKRRDLVSAAVYLLPFLYAWRIHSKVIRCFPRVPLQREDSITGQADTTKI